MSFISILFLLCVCSCRERSCAHTGGFPFSKATPCSHVWVRALPAPVSTSLSLTPFLLWFESLWGCWAPRRVVTCPQPCAQASHMRSRLVLAPAVAAALWGPDFPTSRTRHDLCECPLPKAPATETAWQRCDWPPLLLSNIRSLSECFALFIVHSTKTMLFLSPPPLFLF